jgi:soluble cytochrome b562
VLEKNFKFASIENRIENERAQILKRMDIALRNKNFGNYREAHADMNDFNKGFPSYRIEPDDLANSLEKKQEERGKSYVGIVPTEKNMAIFSSALVESRKPIRERQKETAEKKREVSGRLERP